jgi:hypothetical protein
LLELPDGAGAVRVESSPTDADARIHGAAPDVYRALWNRPADHDVSRGGDAQVLARLDARLHMVTQ